MDVQNKPATQADGGGAPHSPRIAALVVTWNRTADLERCLKALAAQTYPAPRIDVVVVDNASTDGSPDAVAAQWRPERIVQNAAERSDAPAFALGRGVAGANAGGWKSLTLVRNQHNLGGCGGFNTALLMVERTIAAHRAESMVPEDPRLVRAEPLEYVWLIDDDAEPARDCLERLVAAAQADPKIGIAGARMVDPADRRTTVSSAIYFNPGTGLFGAPEPGHPREAEYNAWLARVGHAKGRHDTPEARAALTGVLDVECVAACSMLARWSTARQVGYWDARFFISGDDADWCLRFRRAHHRVVSVLDAVVYHVPCTAKQTVTQDYYRRRNLFWIWQRSLPADTLKRLARARMRLILKQAWHAAWAARATDAEIIRRSAHDAAIGRGGRLDLGPRAAPAIGLGGALASVGVRAATGETTHPAAGSASSTPSGTIAGAGTVSTLAVICPNARTVRRALRLRAEAKRLGIEGVSWVLFAHADAVSDRLSARLAHEGVRFIPYGDRLRSKLKRQLEFVTRPPAAWVIIDGRTDAPLLRPRRVLHVESRAFGKGVTARVERPAPGARLAFTMRWWWTRARAWWYLLRLKPTQFEGKFGTGPTKRPR